MGLNFETSEVLQDEEERKVNRVEGQWRTSSKFYNFTVVERRDLHSRGYTLTSSKE